MTKIIDFLKKYTDGKQNTEKVEISVLQLNRVIKALESEPCTLDDAREDFVFDVYKILDFLPSNDEANQIIDVFDRVTSGLEQEPVLDKIRAEIVKYKADCRLSVDEYLSCKQCTDNVFGSIYSILDKYKAEGEK